MESARSAALTLAAPFPPSVCDRGGGEETGLGGGWGSIVGGGSPGPVRLNDAGGCAAVRVVGWQPRPKMQLLVIALLGLVAAPGASAQLGMAGKPSYMLPSAGFFDNWLILFEQVPC